MWLFDKQGFVSIVAYDPSKDRDPNTKFKKFAKKAGTHLLVRARIKEDLDMLKAVVPSLLVETDPSADYSFRAVVSRAQFKKFLALSVDGIDYWSHFKEAARDNSPKAEGRYTAMMRVWTEMAKLQPHAPYSGGYSGYGSSYSFGGSSFSKPASKPSSGYPTMEAFMEAWSKNPDPEAYRYGKGPRTGFQVGDAVRGFAGDSGEVVSVHLSKIREDLEFVTVKADGKTCQYASNYLLPILEISERDLPWMVSHLTANRDAHEFPIDQLPELGEAALELLIRAQEQQGADAELSQEQMERIIAEVEWEFSTEEGKQKIVAEGTVPEKFVTEALTVFSHKN